MARIKKKRLMYKSRKSERKIQGLRPVLAELAVNLYTSCLSTYSVNKAISLWSTSESTIIYDLPSLDISELFYYGEQLNWLLKLFKRHYSDLSCRELRHLIMCVILNSGRLKNSTKGGRAVKGAPSLDCFSMFAINNGNMPAISSELRKLVKAGYLNRVKGIVNVKPGFQYQPSLKGLRHADQYFQFVSAYLSITQYDKKDENK